MWVESSTPLFLVPLTQHMTAPLIPFPSQIPTPTFIRLCRHCTEYTIARFRCPKGPRSRTKKLALERQRRRKTAVSYLQEQQQR